MFDKILIANRGEIACRVIATAKRLGVKTVAVYSDADAASQHVVMADEAVHIGPPDVTQSYLLGDKIIAAARATGAKAIHPGYGFLSENPDFVDAVTAAGLTFIGPPADAIRAMGLKDAAKTLMSKAGVPVVPGYHGTAQDVATLSAEADKIGYPILIKARAGGGGKGMRLVEHPADFKDALAAAQREGQASFGDPACLLEKYITHPRHIEIQVFGDTHGNVVHMFERDCSLQRRHQKVIEEAPAPDMPPQVRDAMGLAAIEASKAVGYQNAGTVEFIVDGTGPLRVDGFWFMEMNTRLQVEHPVSEAITGLDFVELQLRVAAGEPLPFTQNDLSINGWAMEARVYAEDPSNSFLPTVGTLHHAHFPTDASFENTPLRIDSGVTAGDTISPWYDPMIAKVITHAPTREIARSKLAAALEDTRISGCTTNLEFLANLARNNSFANGQVDTGLIERDIGSLITRPEPCAIVHALAAIGAAGLLPKTCPTQTGRLTGFRVWGHAEHLVTYRHAQAEHTSRITLIAPHRFRVDGLEITLQSDGDAVRVSTDGQQHRAHIALSNGSVTIFMNGSNDTFGLIDPLDQENDEDTNENGITAPIPGLIAQIFVKAGNAVGQGDTLMILEAMKMEHRLTAPRDGIIDEVLCVQGDQVSVGLQLLTLVEADD